jgi:hypothetical protein
MNFDLKTILRAFGMLSAHRSGRKDWVDMLGQLPGLAEYVPLLRSTIAPALSGIGRNRDTSLDDVESDPLKGMESPVAMLDRIAQEAKETNAKRDAEADAKLQAEIVAKKAEPKPMKSPAVDKWREYRATAVDTQPAMDDPGVTAVSPDAAKQPTLQSDLSGILNAQMEASKAKQSSQQPASESSPVETNGEPSRLSTATDAAQSALDAVGVVDPTPISDGINAVWSLGRAFTDPERRGEHLTNAAISTVSMVPYIGDTAKLLKTGRYAKTASRLSKWNEGTSAATKTAQRGNYREAAGSVLGGNGGSGGDNIETVGQGGAAGGNGGSNIPPVSPGISPGGDDEREGEAAARGFFGQLHDAGEAVLGFTGPLGKGALQVVAFIEGLKLLNSGVIALNRDLAPFNGQLSAAYAQGDADQLQRDIRKGDELSGPLSTLIAEQSELKDSMDSIVNPIQAISIGVLGKVTEVVNEVLKVTRVVEASSAALEGIKKALFDLLGIVEAEVKLTGGQQFFHDVSDGKFDGKEPTFNGSRNLFKTDQERKDIFGQ